MKVLVVGGDGRGDALAWKISQSPLVTDVFCAPGNAGTTRHARNVNIAVDDIPALVRFAQKEHVNFTIVGPEKPLTLGIVDAFREQGLDIFGPNRSAAKLEGSKIFTKELLVKHGIPTARHAAFSDVRLAKEFVRNQPLPLVIKADGLAEGKGVYICQDTETAITAIREIMIDRKFGNSGTKICIEEFLDGEEASYIVMVDAHGNILPLASSQDHKRVGDGDTGPNTGGMGAYSPAPVVTPEVERRILTEIIYPTINAMLKKSCPFSGFLYAGLMIDKQRNPKVLEFNVRLGDPETQPILTRMKSDIVPIIRAAINGNLDLFRIDWDERPAVCVVMASQGYPDPNYEKGHPIENLNKASSSLVHVFHAGTKIENGQVLTNGGRVLGVTALGDTYRQAQQNAYKAVGKIRCDNLFYRHDIANRATNRQ